MTNTKPSFSESKANIETLQKLSPYFWVTYEFNLKSVESLNQILWAKEYWFKALKYQIWLTNTESFFWENETNTETFEKLSPYIWIFYKFYLKSVKSLNQILWATEYSLKVLKCQIWLTNINPFFWENDANVETLPISPYIWVFYKFALKSGNSVNRILWVMESWLKALKCQVLRNRGKRWNSLKTFSLYLSFL